MNEGDAALQAAIADAVAAFDEANLAWGQFYTGSWVKRSLAERAQAQPVREALGEAALSVPQRAERDDALAFAAAVREARLRLRAFLGELPSLPEAASLQAVVDTLQAALDTLQPYAPPD